MTCLHSSLRLAGVQYTLRNVPKSVDRAIRAAAKRQGRSLNEVAIEALLRGLGLDDAPRRDLSALAGSWVEDPETDRVLAEQRQIDPELWK